MIIRRINSTRESRMMRVAAYARVSTIKEEQEESFETQFRYYTELIQRNDRWTFVEVYADQGRSGTSVSGRPAFQRMMKDARERKLDIILVKSISRFSRNVADAQKYVYELKELGVEVRFEREAISSFDPSAEMIFNILSAVAQEESRSISENMKWSYRKLAEKGIRNLGNNRVLGYDTDKSGKLVPNEDAWIVRMIFEQYAAGVSVSQIVKTLHDSGAKRIRSDKPFSVSSVQRILTNEIYVGDRLIQKAAPLNYLTKKPDITEPYTSHYVTDDHKAVINRNIWECVKSRLEQIRDERIDGIFKRKTAHDLYGIVCCAKCGAPFTRRTVQGKGGLHKVWKCTERLKGSKGNGCRGAIIAENDLLRMIADRLGWDWVDAEHIDVSALCKAVKRVDVTESGIRVHKVRTACM